MSQLDPPNRPAKQTRQNVLPWKHAKSTREHDPPNSLARDPPFPAQDPQAGHDLPASSPLPPTAPPTEQGGGGQETDPARLCILNRYFYFPLNVYIFLQNITYTHSIQSGQNKYIMYCFRRRKSCKEGVRSWSPPGPVKGSVLHNLKYYRRPAGLPY